MSKLCKNCGAESVDETALTCSSCGQSMQSETVQNQEVQPESAQPESTQASQPVSEQPIYATPEPPVKKSSKSLIIILAAVLGGILIIAAVIFFFNPFGVVQLAKNAALGKTAYYTSIEAGNVKSLMNSFGDMKITAPQNLKTKTEFSVSDLSLGSAMDAMYSGQLDIAKKAKIAVTTEGLSSTGGNADVTMSLGADEVMKANISIANNKLGFNIPLVDDKYYTIDMSTSMTADSYLKMVSDSFNMTEQEAKDMIVSYATLMFKDMKDSSVTFNANDTVGGKVASSYSVVYDGETLKTIIINMLTKMKTDDKLLNGISNLYTRSLVSVTATQPSSLPTAITIDQMKLAIDSAIQEINASNSPIPIVLTNKIYFDNSEKIIGRDITITDTTGTVTLMIQSSDIDNTQTFVASVKSSIPQTGGTSTALASLGGKLSITNTVKDKNNSGKMDLTVDGMGTLMTATYDFTTKQSIAGDVEVGSFKANMNYPGVVTGDIAIDLKENTPMTSYSDSITANVTYNNSTYSGTLLVDQTLEQLSVPFTPKMDATNSLPVSQMPPDFAQKLQEGMKGVPALSGIIPNPTLPPQY